MRNWQFAQKVLAIFLNVQKKPMHAVYCMQMVYISFGDPYMELAKLPKIKSPPNKPRNIKHVYKLRVISDRIDVIKLLNINSDGYFSLT